MVEVVDQVALDRETTGGQADGDDADRVPDEKSDVASEDSSSARGVDVIGSQWCMARMCCSGIPLDPRSANAGYWQQQELNTIFIHEPS